MDSRIIIIPIVLSYLIIALIIFFEQFAPLLLAIVLIIINLIVYFTLVCLYTIHRLLCDPYLAINLPALVFRSDQGNQHDDDSGWPAWNDTPWQPINSTPPHSILSNDESADL